MNSKRLWWRAKVPNLLLILLIWEQVSGMIHDVCTFKMLCRNSKFKSYLLYMSKSKSFTYYDDCAFWYGQIDIQNKIHFSGRPNIQLRPNIQFFRPNVFAECQSSKITKKESKTEFHGVSKIEKSQHSVGNYIVFDW